MASNFKLQTEIYIGKYHHLSNKIKIPYALVLFITKDYIQIRLIETDIEFGIIIPPLVSFDNICEYKSSYQK